MYLNLSLICLLQRQSVFQGETILSGDQQRLPVCSTVFPSFHPAQEVCGTNFSWKTITVSAQVFCFVKHALKVWPWLLRLTFDLQVTGSKKKCHHVEVLQGAGTFKKKKKPVLIQPEMNRKHEHGWWTELLFGHKNKTYNNLNYNILIL